MPKPLKIYRGFSRSGGPGEGACLIFADSVSTAKKLAFVTLSGWFSDMQWTDVAVNRMKESFLLRGQEDRLFAYLARPHVIEAPTSCKSCGFWGKPLDNQGFCLDDCSDS